MATCAQRPIITREEALALAERVERGDATPTDAPLIASLLRQYVELTDLLREKNASIRRLQRVAFGPSSEQRHRGDADADHRDRSA